MFRPIFLTANSRLKNNRDLADGGIDFNSDASYEGQTGAKSISEVSAVFGEALGDYYEESSAAGAEFGVAGSSESGAGVEELAEGYDFECCCDDGRCEC